MTEDGSWPSARWEAALKDPLTKDIIISRVADGETLKGVCKSRQWPYSMVAQWIVENPEIAQAYEGALALWGDALAQETIEIADNADPDMIQHAKLRVDTRTKLASRLNRNRYGETPQVQINAQSGSLIAILSALPPLRAPEEIDVTPEDAKIERAQKATDSETEGHRGTHREVPSGALSQV